MNDYHVKDLDPSHVVETPESSESYNATEKLEKDGKAIEPKRLFSSFSTSTITATQTFTSTLSATNTATICTAATVCVTNNKAADPPVISCSPPTSSCTSLRP